MGKKSLTIQTTPSRSSSERTSMMSSSTKQRTSLSNSTPHGADTANPLPPSGTNSEKNTRITKTLSLPNLMLLLTNSLMLRSKASQPSNISQLTVPCKITTVAELLMTSSNSSNQKQLLRKLRKPKMLKTNCKLPFSGKNLAKL